MVLMKSSLLTIPVPRKRYDEKAPDKGRGSGEEWGMVIQHNGPSYSRFAG